MKHKTSKRSNKLSHPRSYQTQARRSSTSTDRIQTISPNKVDLGTGTVHLDSHTTCLKPNLPLKSQKLLKRDLLRCSNQRPSLLGPQTLQLPRVHHSSQHPHSLTASSSSLIDHEKTPNRRSLSLNSHTVYPATDRIGPWPDTSINRLCSAGVDYLRPIKSFRHTKNPRLFSPKYYAALHDNANIFRFHPSKRTYIEEYRKQKGYLLNTSSTKPQLTSMSLSSSAQLLNSDDDQLSGIGTCSGGGNCTARERSDFSTTNSLLSSRGISKSADDILNKTNRSPIIASVTNILPPIPIRNNNQLRPTRHAQLHHQTITLPSLTNSSIQYLNNMTAAEKAYGDNKKTVAENQSKLYFIDGRQKKRISPCISSESEVTPNSQDHSGLRTPCSPIITKTERPAVVVVYQLPRRSQISTTQNDIGSLS